MFTILPYPIMKYLLSSWENLFQRIKKVIREYEAVHGEWSSINVAVWEPDLNPPLTLRKYVSEFVLKDENWVHTYWDNRAPENFVEELMKYHTWIDTNKYPHCKWLALPWEKAMIWLLPIACWANTNTQAENKWFVRTAPAYDLIWTWAEYLWTESYVWPLYSKDDFHLKMENFPKLENQPRMIITVKPWNPCPAWASREDWIPLIEHCIKNNIRLVNDWAYTGLAYKGHVSLSEIAVDYKELDWIELFSISKSMNACGWRVWVAYWSTDFIDELTKIKWNTDSWAFWPAMNGITKFLQDPVSREEMKITPDLYQKRLGILVPTLEKAWFKLACETEAWFFVLWHCPKTLNWAPINNSEEFNQKMIEACGLVWVPFEWAEIDGEKEQFIRYTVCAPIETEAFTKRLTDALATVEVWY